MFKSKLFKLNVIRTYSDSIFVLINISNASTIDWSKNSNLECSIRKWVL